MMFVVKNDKLEQEAGGWGVGPFTDFIGNILRSQMRIEKLQGTAYDKHTQCSIKSAKRNKNVKTINCKAKDVLRHRTWQEPIKQDRNSEQLFVLVWDSSAMCSEVM